jgi:hypothetical protein
METAIPAPVYPLKTLAPTPLDVLHNGTRQSTSSANTSDYFSMNSREVDYHQACTYPCTLYVFFAAVKNAKWPVIFH